MTHDCQDMKKKKRESENKEKGKTTPPHYGRTHTPKRFKSRIVTYIHVHSNIDILNNLSYPTED